MRFILSLILIGIAGCGLAMLVDNYFHMNWGTVAWTKALTQKPLNVEAVKVHPQEATAPLIEKQPLTVPSTAPAVRIEGKWYAYNPRNLYVVNGVTTYYDPGRKTAKPSDSTPKNVRPGQALGEGPLAVYSPENVKATMDAAKAAANQAQEKNKILEHLSRESDPPGADD